MDSNLTPSAQWDAMTNEERVEWLATRVMGWKYEPSPYDFFWKDDVGRKALGLSHEHSWNPLQSWDAWRQVEEKVMNFGDEGILKNTWLGHFATAGAYTSMWALLEADLPTRAKSLFLATQAMV